jgi:hypothetical protein
MLITGTVSSPAFAATSTGQVRWATNVAAVVSSPTVVKGVVYVGSADSKLHAGGPGHRGHPLADPLTGAVTSPTLDKGLIYAGSGTWLYLVAGYESMCTKPIPGTA